MPMSKEDRDRLTAEHGGPLVLEDAGVMLLPDGAVLRGGVLNPAPADPRRRLDRRRHYHVTYQRWAEKDAEQLAAFLRGEGHPLQRWDENLFGPRPADPRDALKLLRGVVAREREAVAELDRQIGPPVFA
jgi:hypothetical protein